MDTKEKIAVAVRALDSHEANYEHKIPKRVREFWQSGEAFKYANKCLMGGHNIPGWGDAKSTFRLVPAVPSWEVQGMSGGLDDGVVGSEGDWEAARRFIPLFQVESSRFIVARLDKDGVGWFDEECWQDSKNGYDEGVFLLAPSLEKFLAGLGDAKKADFETDSDEVEEIWEEAADSDDDDDDDDDDDEDGEDDED